MLAEFVETKEQQEALEQIGCLLYQGYLYSPAVDLEALTAKAEGTASVDGSASNSV